MSKSNFLLVYGSETGQARAIAEQIAEKSADFGLHANYHCLDELDKAFSLQQETCMVMVTSTTGDGDAPDNASKFLRRIKKRTLPADYLTHLHFAVLGLGDTNYNSFCKCAKDMDCRLEQLGAKRFYPTGYADDGVGLEIVVDPWLEGLYPALKNFLEKSTTEESVNKASLCERINEVVLSDDSKINLSKSCTNGESQDVTSDQMPGLTNCVDSSDLNNKLLPGHENNELLNLNSNNSSHVGERTSDHGNAAPCLKLIDAENGDDDDCDNKSILTIKDLSPSLADKDLTVPVLSPEFLKASFSQETVETENLPYQNGLKLPSSASDVIHAKVTSARVLTHPDALKKTLCLKLSVQGEGKDYEPGDSISIICPNSRSEVQLFLRRLKVSELADQQLTLSVIPDTKKRRAAVPPHIHPTTTLRHLVMTCVSIRDPPSKALLRTLVEYTTDEREKRRLQELCSKQGSDEYTRWIRENAVSLLDVLYAFPSCQPPVERVLEFLPRLLPRPYSLCSCMETSAESLTIAFNLVDVPRDTSVGHFYSRLGVCTGWLDGITSSMQTLENGRDCEDVKIPIFFRSNQHFHPPSDISKPLILVGPGTGVAPFIGFLEQRALLKLEKTEVAKYGETWLFFGCRHKDHDFIFRKELEEFSAAGTLSRLCVSFSRDSNSEYRYVQDYMKAEGDRLASLIVDEEASVCVCGDAKNMCKDVSAAFQEILISCRGLTADEANAFMMKKRLYKTYLEDVWA